MLENTNHFPENYHNDTQKLIKHIILQLPKDYAKHTTNFYEIIETLCDDSLYYTYVDSKTIEKLSINDLQDESKLGYFYCLYACNPLLVLESKNKTTLNSKVITQNFGYKDDFYLLFIANKDSLSNEYLETRKALYKTYQLIKQEQVEDLQKQQQEPEQQLQGLDSKARESKLQEIQKEHTRKQREKERQEQQEARFSKSNTQNLNTTNNNAYITKDSYLVLESNDKETKIIFLDSLKDSQSHIRSFTNFQDSNNSYLANTSLSFTNLILQCNNKVTIFARDNSIIDSKQLEIDFKIDLNNIPCDVYLYSLLLRGGEEDMDNPRFFYGKKGEVYISDESDNIEVCYNNATMKMTNYYYHAYS